MTTGGVGGRRGGGGPGRRARGGDGGGAPETSVGATKSAPCKAVSNGCTGSTFHLFGLL